MTTYNKWKIFWLPEAHGSACSEFLGESTAVHAFDDETASQYECVYATECISRNDPQLIETLVSVLIKMHHTQIEPPLDFVRSVNGEPRKYGFVKSDTFEWRAVPDGYKLDYSLSAPQATCFYLLRDYHGGADGRVWLGATEGGNLAVINLSKSSKFDSECRAWKTIWEAKNARVCTLMGCNSLIIPYAFHAYCAHDGAIRFRSLYKWSAGDSKAEDITAKVGDIPVCAESAHRYCSAPRVAAEEALRSMAEKGYIHCDIKWAHLALLPVRKDGKFILRPILIELHRVELIGEKTVNEIVNAGLAQLDAELLDDCVGSRLKLEKRCGA